MSTTTAGCGGGKPSRSSSAIVADTASGYHILRIYGYSGTKGTPTGEFHRSCSFTVGGYSWFIRYYPNGTTQLSRDYISFFLVLDQSVAKEVKVQYQIRFSDQAEGTPLASEEVTTFRSHSSSGYAEFSKREDLEKSEHLKDDSFAVRCDIVIINNVYAKGIAEEAATPVFVSVSPSDLSTHFGDLLLTENGADVVFEVGSQTFAAHRCVLAARSPVFKAELFGTMKESVTTGVVRIDDIEAQVFKALLYFIYTDSLPKAKTEEEEEEDDVMSQHLLVAADKYNLERLKLICEDKLCKYINEGTVATILALAEQHHCHGLKKACFDFLSSPTNLKAAVDTDGFKHLSRSCPVIMEELIVMLGNLVQQFDT